MEYVFKFVAIVFWISGIVLAKGFWSTFFAVIFAPYSWYLVIEKIFSHFGLI